MRLHQLVYTSVATQPFDDNQLRELLQKARVFNHEHRLTGILLYSTGKFLQVLEGEQEAVQHLYYHRICADPRHVQLKVLADSPAPRRIFPDWGMGFALAKPATFERLTGYITPGPNFLLARAHGADAQLLDLLREFVATHPVES